MQLRMYWLQPPDPDPVGDTSGSRGGLSQHPRGEGLREGAGEGSEGRQSNPTLLW